MAHTRWATHGGKTDQNAHPHQDASGKISIVHNGTINNASDLRRELQASGFQFDSQTDSEVIAKLIGMYYSELVASKDDVTKTSTSLVKIATEKALSHCVGTWGLCVMCSDVPDELVVACHGSPLVLGMAHNRTFVASEPAAFSRHTKTFIPMKDGEIAVLHSDGLGLDVSRQLEAPQQTGKQSPEPYLHWTLKECMEQPEAIARALAFGARLGSDKVLLGGLDSNYERLSEIKYLLLSGCGSSLFAARYGERLMRHLGSVHSVCSIDAGELEEKDYPGKLAVTEAGVIVVSQSGETRDVALAVSSALDRGVAVISVVNEIGSSIARATKLGVYCHAGKEHSMASTKTFTSQVTVLALIALWFRQMRDGGKTSVEASRLKEALMRLPLSVGMALKTRAHCKEIAEKLKNKEHCFVLGKGFGEPVAMEGYVSCLFSMKLKSVFAH
jgi:glutamine---fructose-6-phosphate transaminase (isomerizing)